MSMSLREAIETIKANRAFVPAHCDSFVEQMIAGLEKYGDSFFVSRRQRGFLCAIIGQYLPQTKTSDKPKSRLQELKEKKAMLLAQSRRAALRKTSVNNQKSIALAKLGAGELQVSDAPTAKMRHAKSLARQLHHAPLLAKTTKR